MAATHDYPEIIIGDSVRPKTVTLERFQGATLVSLIDATVTFEVVRGPNSTVYLTRDSDTVAHVQIVDAVNCVVNIKQIEPLVLPVGEYSYVIRVLYSDGMKVTFAGGRLGVVTKERKKSAIEL